MEELLQAPTDGVGDAIGVSLVLANQFELKIGLLNLVTAITFHGFENDDPHSHIRRFMKITQTVKLNKVPSDVVKLLLFLFSLEGAAQTWLEKEPPKSITTWNDLVSKFVNRYFPPSKTTNLRNEITRYQQRFASGNFLTKNTQEALTIIENKYKGQTSRNKPQVASASRSSTQDVHITSLTKQVEALFSLHRPVNSVRNGCKTCGYYQNQGQNANQAPNQSSTDDLLRQLLIQNQNLKRDQEATNQFVQTQIGQLTKALQERPQGVLPSNTIPNPQEVLKVITTRSGVTLARPSIPPPPLSSTKEVEREPESTTDQVLIESTTRVPPPVVQPSPASTSSELPPAPISCPMIPDLAEALAHMPNFAKMVKDLLTNKEKLLKLANTPLNENCLVVLLKKLPEKLGDTGRFLIPCDFYGLESCMALADLGASINLMPLSVWKALSLPELTLTRMTLKLATRTVAYPAGVAEDVFVQVGKFTFPADFVVVDYDVDPRVPLILGRPFLRTAHALVDVHGEELTLQVGDEKLVFNDHFHEVLNVQKSINPMSGSPTPSSEPVVASLSPSLTPFRDSDFILEEIDTFLASNDSSSPDDHNGTFDMEGDIRLIEELLNNDISNDLPPPLPVFVVNETEKIKSSIDDPLDLKLKDLPPHLEYVFLE
ncbi:reverse transcriptase domain-containing protein [Tanacetum coccineum]